MKVLILSFVLAFIVIAIVPSAHAQINDPPGASSEQGGNIIDNASGGKGSILVPDCLRLAKDVRTATGDCVIKTITFYTNLLLYVVGIGAFGYMLYGSFLYATAFGDETKIGKAKKTITFAIVGVILSGSALLIVQLIRTILRA